MPALLVLALPMGLLGIGLPEVDFRTYVPVPDGILWTAISVAPLVTAYLIFAQDWQSNHSHHPYEFVAAFTLWPYLAFQTVVFVTALIEEFVLRKPSVYVTTSRSGTSR